MRTEEAASCQSSLSLLLKGHGLGGDYNLGPYYVENLGFYMQYRYSFFYNVSIRVISYICKYYILYVFLKIKSFLGFFCFVVVLIHASFP